MDRSPGTAALDQYWWSGQLGAMVWWWHCVDVDSGEGGGKMEFYCSIWKGESFEAKRGFDPCTAEH
jgi:hypothetical protein